MNDIVKLNWRDGATTDFLENLLVEFNQGNRVQILVRAGEELSVIARVRMRLSRVRTSMRNQDKPMRHFKLGVEHFPYTNSLNQRCTCIVFRKIYNRRHEIKEYLQGAMYANPRGNDGQAETQQPITTGVEW